MISRPSRSLPLSLSKKRVLLVGLGLHGGGVGTTKWLLDQGAQVRVTDTKTAEELASSLAQLPVKRITCHLGGYVPADFRWADVIVLNPAVNPQAPDMQRLIPKKTRVENELTLFLARCPAKTIGITGTRGKTTTTLLITHILKAAGKKVVASGNVRQEPMLSVLPKLTKDHIVVLELSSFQLELLPHIQKSPDLALMTNLSVDHLTRHGTMRAYQQTKSNIFRYQSSTDTAILNTENTWTKQLVSHMSGRVITFSTRGHSGQHSLTIEKGWVTERHGRTTERLFPVSHFRLPGAHQQQNLLGAIAAVRVLGVSASQIVRGLKSFRGVGHRQELVRTWKGHAFINDTAATSPEGALAALDVFPHGVFILGGTDKQLDFRALAVHLVRHRVPMVFLPGSATERLLGQLKKQGWKQTPHIADSMEGAIREAIHRAKPGQAIVLSPGAASFGLFLHEFDRGEKFIRAVKRLGTI